MEPVREEVEYPASKASPLEACLADAPAAAGDFARVRLVAVSEPIEIFDLVSELVMSAGELNEQGPGLGLPLRQAVGMLIRYTVHLTLLLQVRRLWQLLL